MMKFDIQTAKTQLPKLIEYARSGIEVSITDGGSPIAQLVAVGTKQLETEKYDFLGWLEKNPLPAYAKRSGKEIDETVEEIRSCKGKSEEEKFQREAAS